MSFKALTKQSALISRMHKQVVTARNLGEFGWDLLGVELENLYVCAQEQGYHGIGVWHHNHHTYIDPISVIPNLYRAYRLAEVNGEQAIYDLGRAECIFRVDLERSNELRLDVGLV